MAPTKKLNNAKYCKKYRQKNLEKMTRRERSLNASTESIVSPKKYEEYLRKERERKKKPVYSFLANEPEPNDSASNMNTPSPSAFKHVSTKSRSIKRVESALPKSPHKRNEVVSSIAEKYKLRINLVKNKGGRPRKDLSDEQKQWLRNALDRSDLSMMNPGKKDNVYVGKSNGQRQYERKTLLIMAN